MKNIATQQRMKYITFIAWVILPGLIGFTACSKDEENPVAVETSVGSASASDITRTTATFEGGTSVLGSVGITDHGFVWSLSTNTIPTLNENLGTVSLGPLETTGTVTYAATDLTEGKTYQVRFYAQEADGDVLYTDATTFTMESGWTQLSDYPFDKARAGVAGFAIGDKAYIGGGADIDSPDSRDDFWEYDPAANTWTQIASVGTAFQRGVGFAIGTTGYIFTGSELWAYNVSANTWTQKAAFPGASRLDPIAFVLDNKVYIGTGITTSSSTLKDLWEYNPTTDTWTEKTAFPGTERYRAVGTTIQDKGYVGLGSSESLEGFSDLWEYDATANNWSEKTGISSDLISTGRSTYFTLNNKIYVRKFLGFFVYDPSTNTWSEKGSIDNVSNSWFGIAINSKGYTMMPLENITHKEVWEYAPE